MTNKMTLDDYFNLLQNTSRRQQTAFAYHISEDGWPVWDSADVPDEYTTELYAKEQMP